VNELACGGQVNKDTMFKCINATYCPYVEPEDTAKIALMNISDPW